MIGRRGKMKPGIVASLQGTREPRMNIRNVPATNPVPDVILIVILSAGTPPFQKRQLMMKRWPLSSGTEISLR